MSLTLIPTNTKNTVIQAGDINQIINVLQQPSGGQEAGHYFLEAPGYTNGATVSWYIPSLSRNATPISVSVDTSDQANVGFQNATPNTNHLTMGGFQIWNPTSGAQGNPRAGGNYTIQF